MGGHRSYKPHGSPSRNHATKSSVQMLKMVFGRRAMVLPEELAADQMQREFPKIPRD
jgi:hypothetical protein